MVPESLQLTIGTAARAGRRATRLSVMGLAAMGLAACVPPDFSRTPEPEPPVARPAPAEPTRVPAPVEPAPIPEPSVPGTVAPVPPPPPPPSAPPVGAAGLALLQESRAHQAAGRLPQAAASIERALRIEPRQPVLWLELGNIRLREGDFAQAESMARKALSLSAGDPAIETRAQRLLAEAQRR